MRPILERVGRGEVLLADGAMGTQLMARGLKSGECPEALNLDRPDVVASVSADYAAAGADIVLTNTFGGSPLKLALYGLEGQTEAINAAAVAAARRGAGAGVYVAASCGPTGRMLQPYGDTPPAAVAAAFARQLAALAAAGVDLIVVETMTDLAEAVLAVAAARAAAPGVPVAATMTFDVTPNGFFTIMGVDIPRAVRELAAAGAHILGSNCGVGIEPMVAVAAELRRATDRPLLVQANAGLPQMRVGAPVWPETPDVYAGRAAALPALGVGIIGGCCGTTPAHITALRRMLDVRR